MLLFPYYAFIYVLIVFYVLAQRSLLNSMPTDNEKLLAFVVNFEVYCLLNMNFSISFKYLSPLFNRNKIKRRKLLAVTGVEIQGAGQMLKNMFML